MKLGNIDSFTLEIITKLYADQDISTPELKEVLRLAGVNAVIIDYIADLHTNKVEGKNYGRTTAKRSRQKMLAYNAVYDVIANAEKPIKLSKAITEAALNLGVDRKTLKRHIEEPGRIR